MKIYSKAVHPDKALERILSRVPRLKPERVKVSQAFGRILSEPVFSNLDLPPFDKSAMDGFACVDDDESASLEVVETIPAGHRPRKTIVAGTCARIMTGAMIPEGTGRVISRECVEEIESGTGSKKMITIKIREDWGNICYQGEDLKKGQRVLEAGTKIRQQEIALLSAVGCSTVSVSSLPRVGIISTGSELLKPGKKIGPAQIFDSNGPQLANQVSSTPALCIPYGIVKDDPERIRKVFSQAFRECDLVIISGGVSMGDYDFVPGVLEKLGAEIILEHIAIKPGKPAIFAEKGNVGAFGLPGNPVSTFILFEVFVRPLLCAMMGQVFFPRLIRAELAEKIKRKKTDRVEFIPVRFDGEHAHPVVYNGPGHIDALCRTNALLRIEQGCSEIPRGTIVRIREI